jgi:hypothetical protein
MTHLCRRSRRAKHHSRTPHRQALLSNYSCLCTASAITTAGRRPAVHCCRCIALASWLYSHPPRPLHTDPATGLSQFAPTEDRVGVSPASGSAHWQAWPGGTALTRRPMGGSASGFASGSTSGFGSASDVDSGVTSVTVVARMPPVVVDAVRMPPVVVDAVTWRDSEPQSALPVVAGLSVVSPWSPDDSGLQDLVGLRYVLCTR